MQGNPKAGWNARKMHDFYPTARSHVLPVLRYLDHEYPVWDPAVGDGALLDVIAEHGYATTGSDLVDYGRGYPEMDFLETDPFSAPEVQVVQIVTNPPYRHATEFIVHAIEYLRAPLVCMLLPVHYLGSHARARGLFTKHPPTRVGIVPTRMDVKGSGVSQFYHAWFVWQRERRMEGTRLEWLD